MRGWKGWKWTSLASDLMSVEIFRDRTRLTVTWDEAVCLGHGLERSGALGS